MKTIRIMTFNVQMGKYLDRMHVWLKHISYVDIMCFQEYPQEKIINFISVFGKDIYGYRFTQSLLWRKHVYGEFTVFKKKNIRCISSVVKTLGTNKFENRILKNTIPRSCLITKFNWRNQKSVCVIANVHLAAFAVNRYKLHQASVVVNALMKYKSPSIILGDFNISNIMGKRNLIALFGMYGYNTEDKKMITHHISLLKHQFDYVFIKNCRLASLEVVRVRLSDHYPVFATVVI